MTEMTRRTMSAALRTVDLPAEQLAFVRAGTPKPVTSEPRLVPRSNPESENRSPVPTGEMSAADVEMVPASEQRAARSARPKVAREAEEGAMHGPALVALSVRIPGSLSVELLRASTERRIQGLKPFRQQEIVAEALEQWLKASGFGK